MNIPLLREVAQWTLDHPEHFDMHDYFSNVQVRLENNVPDITQCGTTACIAGTALYLRRGIVNEECPRNYLGNSEDTASHLLGIRSSQGYRLFHLSGWPEQLQADYWRAETGEEKARIAAARIEHFISTEGRE
jgi:hypothetical protein